jgi:hypothetical protein
VVGRIEAMMILDGGQGKGEGDGFEEEEKGDW